MNADEGGRALDGGVFGLKAGYEVEVDIDVKVQRLSQDGNEDVQGRLLDLILRDQNALDQWLAIEAGFMVRGGDMSDFEDPAPHRFMTALMPSLANDDREYFERYLDEERFYELAGNAMDACRSTCEHARLDCIAQQELEDGGVRRTYRATIDVKVEVSDLGEPFVRKCFERIREYYPEETTPDFGEFLDRQRRLVAAMGSHPTTLDAWMKEHALAHVIDWGSKRFWPLVLNREVFAPLISEMSFEDQEYFRIQHPDRSFHFIEAAVETEVKSMDARKA